MIGIYAIVFTIKLTFFWKLKSNTTRKTLSIFLILTLLVILVSISNKNASAEEKRVINIACNVPLTGSLAVFGASIQEGVEMALREQEEKNGQPSPVKFVWDDNQSEAKQAVSILHHQLLSPIDIYVSGVKPQTMAIKDDILKKGNTSFSMES